MLESVGVRESLSDGMATAERIAFFFPVGSTSRSGGFRTQLLLLRRLALGLLLWFLTSSPAFSQRWPHERTVGPFRFHADFALEGAMDTLRETARLSEVIPDLLKLPRGRETVWVYLFQDQATYRRYLEQYFPEVPLRRALYIKGRGPGMVFAHAGDGFEVDLRHESTHAILHTLLPEVPLWLDEGLAEYFERTASDLPAEERALESVLRDIRAAHVPRLEELELKTDMRQMQAADYRHAWAWTHFLIHGPAPVRQVFRDYLRELQVQGAMPSLAQRLARAYPDYENAFPTYLQSLR